MAADVLPKEEARSSSATTIIFIGRNIPILAPEKLPSV